MESERESVERKGTLWEKLKEAAIEQILDAAEAVLTRKGLDGTTMHDIAAAVGCAAGTLYLHFKSKDALFQAINARRAEAMFAKAHAAMNEGTDPLDRLRRGIQSHIQYINDNREFFRLFLSVHHFRLKTMRSTTAAELMALRDQYTEAELACLREAQELGLVRRDIPAEVLNITLDAIAINLIDEFVQPGNQQATDELLHVVWGLFLYGIAGNKGSAS